MFNNMLPKYYIPFTKTSKLDSHIYPLSFCDLTFKVLIFFMSLMPFTFGVSPPTVESRLIVTSSAPLTPKSAAQSSADSRGTSCVIVRPHPPEFSNTLHPSVPFPKS